MFASAYCSRTRMFLNLHRKQLLRYQQDTFQSIILGRRIAPHSTAMASVKPPNILVYSETASVKQELLNSLQDVLEPDCYTVYPIAKTQIEANAWPDSTALLVVHGRVESALSRVFLDFFLNGGKVLSLCSDLIGTMIPSCKEVRTTEEVTLSYEAWRNIRVMQDIRPLDQSETHFIEHLTDLRNNQHDVDVKVLAVEESFNTPSILTAASAQFSGQAVLTQISFTNSDEQLKANLLKHFLSSLLGIKLKKSHDTEILQYKTAFLLGTEQSKRKLLTSLDIPGQLITNTLSIHFQPESDQVPTPSASCLPVLTDTLPVDFDYPHYERLLQTNHLGRPTIYAPVITTSMAVVSHASLSHGLVVIPRRQTSGNGRSNNQWLSPEGCAMFSLQLHVPLDSPLGQRLPMVQHLVAIGVVSALKNFPGCAQLDVGLKWPNDIYAGGRSKIGGIIVNSQLQSAKAVVNVGCGVNLNNSRPTTCVNDLIRALGPNVPLLRMEQMFALVFNEIERIFELIQNGADAQPLYEMYYKYWLHGGKSVTMKHEDGLNVSGTIVGIDEYGYLMVQPDGVGKPLCVHPDGNSFDMMKGLIIPKYC